MSSASTGPSFTPKQGQYLAFIYAYTRVLGRPPAEADLQRHFGVSPPSVHQMVLTLERAAAIYTLIESAKLNGIDPQAWLADVLARLPDHPAKRIGDLLPWAWKAAHAISPT